MKRTTMTVAAFLVASAASYAAVVPTNAGVEVTVAKNQTTGTVELTLEKGKYGLSVDGATIEKVEKGKDGVAPISGDYEFDKQTTVTVTIKASTTSDKDRKFTLKVTPKANEWVAYVQARQNTLSGAFTLAQALPTEKDFELKKHDDLVDEGIGLQKEINALGIDEYNKFLEKGKLEDLEKKLGDYEEKANDATVNKKQYDYAKAEVANKISFTALDAAYEKSEKTDDIKAGYDAQYNYVNAYKDQIEEAYKNGTAPETLSTTKVDAKVKELQAGIDNQTKAITTGNANLSAYNTVKSKVESLISTYNSKVDAVYKGTIAVETAKDGSFTYQDKYDAALVILNKELAKVNKVKTDNQSLYDEGKHNATKQAELLAVLNTVNFGPSEVTAILTDVDGLKKAYDAECKKISDFITAHESEANNAINDDRKDSKGASIKDYFKGKKNAIYGTNRTKGMLDKLQAQLDEANKTHTHEDATTWDTGDNSWKKIKEADKALEADLREYNAFVQIQKDLESLQKSWDNGDKTNLGVKQTVEGYTKGAFVATNHFSSDDVVTALDNYKKGGDVYVLGSQYDKDATKRTPCQDFVNDQEKGEYHLKSVFIGKRDAYSGAADAAWTNFNKINDAFVAYDEEVNGKGESGKEGFIASWASKVKNENVIVGINGWRYDSSVADPFAGVGKDTYGSKKATDDSVRKTAEEELNKVLAYAKDDAKFSTDLDTHAGKVGEIDNAKNDIKNLKASYAGDEASWFSYTNYKAASDAKDEANDKTAELTKKIKVADGSALITHAAADYGTAAAKALNDDITKFSNDLTAVQNAIDEATAELDPATALPALAEAKTKLAEIEKAIGAHEEKCAAYKKTFADVKSRYDAIDVLINGNGKTDNTKVPSIKELLGTVNSATSTLATGVKTKFNTEVDAANDALTTLWNTIDNTKDIAAGLADSKKDDKVVKGFTSLLNDIENSAKALRTHAVNEDNNQKAMNEWDGLIAKYRTVDNVDQSVQDILDAAKAAIKKADGDANAINTIGEQYYLNLINSTDANNPGYAAQINAHKNTAETDYQVKKDDYTDTSKNLAATLSALKSSLKSIVDAVDQLGAKAEANEKAYKAQKDQLAKVTSSYNEVNVLVNSSEAYKGSNYEAAFKAAIAELTGINAKIKQYGNDYENWYATGQSQKEDGDCAKLTSYANAITAVKASWEAGDNSYNAAVAADNKILKEKYDAEWNALYAFYYGTTTEKGVIDYINRLKGLTQYSDQVTDDVKAIVTGDASIYTKAAEIQKLKKVTQDEYDALTPGQNWVEGQADAVQAVKDLKAKIEKQQNDYADAINALIADDYNTAMNTADQAIIDAEYVVAYTLDIDYSNDTDEIKRLLKLEKSNGKSAYDIQKRAVEIASEVDFACLFVEEGIKDQLEKTVPSLLNTSKEKAAQEYYGKIYNAINTSSEAAQIAEFYYVDGYTSSTPSADFEKGGYSADYNDFVVNTWNALKTPAEVKFADYTSSRADLDACLTTYPVKEGNKTVYKPCTKEFKTAFDANEQYKSNKANEVELNKANAELAAYKATALNYATNLLVEHDVEIPVRLKGITLTNASELAAKKIMVDDVVTEIFKKENVALGVEITNYLKLLAAPTETSDELNSRNDRIWNDFDSGKTDADGKWIFDDGGNKVKATAAETYAEYLKLEKDLSDALNVEIENALADAQAAVTEKVNDAKAAVAGAEEKQQAAHAKNKRDFADDIDQLKADLKTLEDKIALQGNAIVLEKVNNIKSAENILADAATTCQSISNAEIDYIANDNLVTGFTNTLNDHNKDLDRYVETIDGLKYVEVINGYAPSGKTYTENLKEDSKNYYVDPITEAIDNLESDLDNDRDDWSNSTNNIDNRLGWYKENIVWYYNYALWIDGKEAYRALNNPNYNPDGENSVYSKLLNRVNNTPTANEEEKKAIIKQINELYTRAYNAYQYLYNGLTDDNHYIETTEEVWTSTDINTGKTIYEDDGEQVRWTAYQTGQIHAQVLAVFAEVEAEYKKIDDSIVTPGAITNGKEVSNADLSKMVNFILEKTTPETDAQRKAADINGNGVFDVADLQAIVNWLLYGDYKGRNNAPARMAVNAQTIGSMGMFLSASELNLTLDTELSYTAVQFDVTLPAGVILTDAAMAANVEGVSVKFNKVGENTWRVLAFSNQNHNIIESIDFINLSLAGQGSGLVAVTNAKGATTSGVLLSIPGVQQSMEVTTGINATMAQAKQYIYGVDGMVRDSFSKGINIVKDAANKVKKVLKK